MTVDLDRLVLVPLVLIKAKQIQCVLIRVPVEVENLLGRIAETLIDSSLSCMELECLLTLLTVIVDHHVLLFLEDKHDLVTVVLLLG